jgi:hypothetical protein
MVSDRPALGKNHIYTPLQLLVNILSTERPLGVYYRAIKARDIKHTILTIFTCGVE